MVQYLRGEIGVPTGGFTEPLKSKFTKYRNLDPAEGCPRAKLGGYNFDKAAEELSSKYRSYDISDKDVIIY